MTMASFPKFKLRSQRRVQRKNTLAEVMPCGNEFRYFVLLSDAYLTSGREEWHISSFDGLQKVLGSVDEMQGLLMAREQGKLTEGKYSLPVPIADRLADAGIDPVLVRRWLFGETEPVITEISLSEVKDRWADLEFEEVEVATASGSWYFRAKDDDPLIFLAVSDRKLLDQLQEYRSYCREVSGDFVYTY